MNKIIRFTVLLLLFFISVSCFQKEKVIVVSEQSSLRVSFAVERLIDALTVQGYRVHLSDQVLKSATDPQIIVGPFKGKLLSGFLQNSKSLDTLSNEGFIIQSTGKTILIGGVAESGLLYGCLELANQLKENGKLPARISLQDEPEMVLRGTCIGMQKPVYLPGRHVYEYPYTPENFPWFYDKGHWIEYLDMMVDNRFNSLYLWNGHPFASLVKLDDYPYAVEVDDATFELNEDMFGFITAEANKRGIWVIQMFYNIIVSKPFAEKHHIATQSRNRPITPLIADYTRKSIAAFIGKYPNVGLMVCLGEAIDTIEDDVTWFTKTIIPGVKDGLKALGRTDEPPLVLRGHDTDAEKVMAAALPIYKNLYTTAKYNGESLTTYEPRDSWEQMHTGLSKLGSVHISNVHILANLEPFRYGSPDFIQKSILAMHTIQGANGLHLYPQASYWDWPYTADKASPRIKQVDRDWIWYKAWARYAWNSQRERDDEVAYWSNQLSDYYGCGTDGENILEAYEQTGEIAPKLLRTFGISDGNRQTLLLGMFMSQLVNPQKYNVYTNFWPSSGPVKEVLQVYAKKEFDGETHLGETPPQIIAEVTEHGRKAVEAIDAVSNQITRNEDEFKHLKNDIYCYDAFANFFSEKVKAAMLVLRYKYSGDVSDLEKAMPHLEKSVVHFQSLVDLTKDTYFYANSMQTQQRRIPITGRDGTNKTWAELLVHYETELDNFKKNLEKLKLPHIQTDNNLAIVYEQADVEILNKNIQWYSLEKGQQVYFDNNCTIEEVAPELKNLKGIQFGDDLQREDGTTLRFKNKAPVKILVGYFNTNSYSTLRPPTLETNAMANNRGQADIRIANAMRIDGLYPVNVYTYHFESGENELKLGRGRVLILGFIDGKNEIQIHDAGITDSKDSVSVDWLFY